MKLQFFETEYKIAKTFDELGDFFRSKDSACFDYFAKNEGLIYAQLMNLMNKLTADQKKGWPIDHQIKSLLAILFNIHHQILHELISKTQFNLTGLLRSNRVSNNFIID